MEIDMSPYTQDQELDTKIINNLNNHISIDIDPLFKPVNVDLSIFSSNIELGISDKQIDLSFDIGEGKGSKVYTDNVYFKDNVLAAGEYTQVGNINKSKDESIELETKGKTLADFIRMVFTKELQPSKTEPSVSLSSPQSGSYEVGRTVTPSYQASFNPGSYTYGPATGVTVESWKITDSNGNEDSASSGRFPEITITDTTNYTIKATATHTEGAVALTNLGNESIPEVKIEAGTKSRTSAAITGYRSFFYGVLDTDDSTILTSAIIRGLTNGGNYNGQKTFVVNANAVSDPKRIIIAIPANTSRIGLKQVLLTSAFDTDITAQYIEQQQRINVEGYNGYSSIPYKIYQYQPARIDAGEIHTITLG